MRHQLFCLKMSVAVVALALMAACSGGGESTETADQGPAKPRIALIMKSMANEFFITMAKGAEEYQRQHPDQFELILNGIKDERDLNQQVALVEQMIAQRVQAIVIAPADSKALVGVCKRAQKAGIQVINIDNRFDKDVLAQNQITIPFVGPDNRAGARTVGNELAKQLSPGDKVAIIEGVPTAFNSQQRRAGFEDAMKEAGMNVVSIQSAQWEMDRANTLASALIGEHPDLKGLLCCNDSMALGAVAAVTAAGKTGQIKVIGFDNIKAAQDMIRQGTILATVDQHGDQLAIFGIEYALQLLTQQGEPTDRQTPVDLITRKDLEQQ